MKKQLYYYFYTRRDTLFNKVNELHLTCLNYYKNVFDEVFICIGIDDINDRELIKDTQDAFFNIFSGMSLTFKIVKNDDKLHEIKFFNDEILNKLEHLDLVFFGHNVYSCDDNGIKYENLTYIIIGLYAMSFDDINEAVSPLMKGHYVTDAPYHIIISNKSYYLYNFLWINTKRLVFFINKTGKFTYDLGYEDYINNYLDCFKKIDCTLIKGSSTPTELYFTYITDTTKSSKDISRDINFVKNIYTHLSMWVKNIYDIKNKILT